MAKIIKLSTKTVTTQYGEKEKFLVTIEQDGKKIVADSFCGKWNNDWREGLELEIKANQWKKREYNGKTYWSIMAPPEAKGGFVNPQEIYQMKAMLESHETLINSLVPLVKYIPMLQALEAKSQEAGIAPATPTSTEEIPVVEEGFPEEEGGVILEDVPF